MSSPSVCFEKPPVSSRRSRRKTPNAPLTIRSAFSRAQAIREPRKLRRYSTVCVASIPRIRTRGSTRRLSTKRPPLAIRTIPPHATTRLGSAVKAATASAIASGSSRLSASVTATRSCRATAIPALTASDRPPLTFRTTRRRGSLREIKSWSIRSVSRPKPPPTGSSTRSYAASSAALVPSVEPSSTTTTRSGS